MMASDHLIHHLDDPANAIAPYPSFYEGPRLDFESADEKSQVAGHERYDSDCTLWVGNLDLRISETMLFELFAQVGDIRNITFPKQKQDEEKTSIFCFVNFMLPDSVPRAIDMMQGTVLFGRKLYLRCRPDSIHAVNHPKFCRTVRLVKKSNLGDRRDNCRKEDHSEFKNAPVIPDGRTHAVEMKSYSSHGKKSLLGSHSPRYSPIRAPSPDDSDCSKKSCDRNLSNQAQSSSETPCSSRRKVVIRSSSGSIVPVVNIPNQVEPRISSVIITPPPAKKVVKPASQPDKDTTRKLPLLSPIKSSVSPNPKPSGASPRVRVTETTVNAQETLDKVHARPDMSRMDSIIPNSDPAFPASYPQGSSQESYYVQHNQPQSSQWRPPYFHTGQQYNRPCYPQVHMDTPRAPAPHYNRYVWFNGNSRYQNNFQRFRPQNFQKPPSSFLEQPNYGNNSNCHAPAPYFNPRFNPNFYQHQPQHYNNYYNSYGQENQQQQSYAPQNYCYNNEQMQTNACYQQPAPPLNHSRSPPRVRSRSRSPRYSSHRRELGSGDKFSRIGRSRSRSRSLSYDRSRRSFSRESSYDRYYSSKRAPRSRSRSRSRSSSDTDSYRIKHKRQRRSQSYSTSPERRKDSREASVAKARSWNSSESDQEKHEHKCNETDASSSDSSDNDTTAVSSSSQKKRTKSKRKKSKKSLKGDTNQGKSKRSRSSRSDKDSEEREYDPSDPGY